MTSFPHKTFAQNLQITQIKAFFSRSSPTRTSYDQTYRHSSRIRKLRRVLPVTALMGIILIVLWSSLGQFFEKKILGIPDYNDSLQVHNHVTNVSLLSTDEKGNPYKIRAEHGYQIAKNKVSVAKPSGEFLLNSGQIMTMTSDHGVIDQATNQVIYSGNVTLSTSDGYTVTTDHAVMDISTQKADGDKTVHGYGPMGKLFASQGFTLEKKENKLIFKGPTRLIINQSKGATP